MIFWANLAFADRLADKKSYYPQSFYAEVGNGQTGAELKKSLFEVLNSAHTPQPGSHDTLSTGCTSRGCYKQTVLGYTPARKILFGELHLERVGSQYAIRDIYCEYLSVESDYKNNPPGPGKIPDSKELNVEHIWPQSKFTNKFPTEMQKSDLHILYPARPDINTSRSNHEFGEVVTVLNTPCTQSRRGYTAGGGRDIHFEPPAVSKGNVARALFYFSVRYKTPISADEEASLKAWHRQDPPDAFERRRNDEIFNKQKVRNPFIDHRELVDLIQDF
jgi:hypothetical protein